MKKVYLFIVFMAMAVTASAQILEEGKKFYGGIDDFHLIPKQFTYEGKTLLIFKQNGIVSTYNSDFEKIHEFEFEGSIAGFFFMDADDNSYPSYEADSRLNLSQTLFNTDEKFEYIRMDSSDEDDEREGFSIVQEDGTVLQSVKGDYRREFMVLKIDGKIYLIAETENEYYEGYMVFFLIDRKTNSLKQVNSLPGLRIRPTIADRNQQVTVDLEDDAREIQVVNAAGQTIKRIPLGVGQRQVTFNTRGMSSGVNVVRSKGRNADASQKFIVK